MQPRVRRLGAMALALVLALLGPTALRSSSQQGVPPTRPFRVVPRAEILDAMRRSVGYSLTATSNSARLQAEVLLLLIRGAERSDPDRRPLLIGHGEWFEALLRRTGRSPATAPLAVRMSNDLGQDVLVDYRRERVVDTVLTGPQPLAAANVWIYWPEAPGRPEKSSYDDPYSNPKLRVTQERIIDYRLVDYGDRLWYAEIHGLHGRPTSGPLGALFALIGEASVVDSRSATAPDGTVVSRTQARKWGFDRTETVTIFRSGLVVRGLPPGRPDLETLAARLAEPLEIRFLPLDEPPGQRSRELPERDP